jgi:hypothetical protein
MKDLKKVLYVGLVIGIAGLMCLQAGALSTTKSSIRNDEPILSLSGGDVLLSVDNPDGDDMNPKITRNNAGTLVVVYEKEVDIFSKSVNVLFSEDQGETWDIAFNFDSIDFPEGSGILNSPDIVYASESGGFYLQMIDPAAGMYNQEFAWFQEDIANAESASWYGISGQGSTDYTEGAISNVGKWIAGMEIDSGHVTQGMGLSWFWYTTDTEEWLQPVDYNANWAAGFYYDGESLLVTHPATAPEMDSGSSMIYLVAQTDLDGGSKISYKATPNDLDPNSDTFTFMAGGGPSDMDKYADIEVWGLDKALDQKYVDDGTDPDVSASGDSVVVVYAQNGQVKCAYSSDRGRDMQISTVGSGGYPAVHMSGDQVTCAYVNGGNLFTVISEDGGATWGSPMQVNEIDGTVAEEPGAVDICDLGVVWVDTRDGQKDIYVAGGASAPIIEIAGISGGFGVTATIANSGTADATGVEVTITIDASLMILGGEAGDTIDIPAGTEQSVSSGLILGFGPADITVNAGGVTETVSGTVLGPLVIGL